MRNRLVNVMWSWPFVIIAGIILMVPLYGPYAGKLEGAIYPVLLKGELIDVAESEFGVSFRYRVMKQRFCDFSGLDLTKDGMHYSATIIDNAGSIGGTAPSGVKITSVLFQAEGLFSLKGVVVTAFHDCDGFWPVFSYIGTGK